MLQRCILRLLKHSQIKNYVVFKANYAINSIVILRDLFQNGFTAVCRRYDRETHIARTATLIITSFNNTLFIGDRDRVDIQLNTTLCFKKK